MLSEAEVREAYDTLKAFILTSRAIEIQPKTMLAKAIAEQHVEEGVSEDVRRKALFTLLHGLAGVLELDEASAQGFREMLDNARNAVADYQRLRRHEGN